MLSHEDKCKKYNEYKQGLRVIVDAEDWCVRAQDATSDRGCGIHGGVEYSSEGYEE